MKRYLLILQLFIAFNFLKAQVPYYNFSFGLGVNNLDRGKDQLVDALGNIYVLGDFVGTGIDLDPGAGSYTLSTPTGYIRGVLIKYSPNGQFLWAVRIATGGYDITANALAMDASGNIYVTGSYAGASVVDFDPGSSTFNLTTNGGLADVYVSKYNSSGTFQWAISFGGNNAADSPYDIHVSNAGDVYVSGFIEGTGADFDPGAGTAILNPLGNSDGFVAKYNTNGQYVWAFLTGGSDFDSWSYFALDQNENVYVMGEFASANVDVDPGTGSAILSATSTDYDCFIAKYNSSGQYQWSFKIGSTANDWGGGMATDPSGDVYATGYFGSSVDFDPGAGSATLNGTGGACYIAKYSATGSYINAVKLSGANSISPSNDADGNIYVTGSFTGSQDFDPGSGVQTVSNSGVKDVFVAKYTPSLVYAWAFSVGGSSYDYGTAISVDAYKNVTVCGYYESTSMDCNPSSTVNLVSNAGMSDFVLARYSQSPDVGIQEAQNSYATSVSPNPSSGRFIVKWDSENLFDIKIYNALGELVKTIPQCNSGTYVDLNGQSSGMYNIVCTSLENSKVLKVIIE